jgi:hypothetical protein
MHVMIFCEEDKECFWTGVNRYIFFLIHDQRRWAICREETEQAREAGDKAQVAAEAGAEAAEAGEAVLLQAPGDIVFAPTAVKDRPINWGAPVMSSHVPNAGRP